jgi:hypothetical protein
MNAKEIVAKSTADRRKVGEFTLKIAQKCGFDMNLDGLVMLLIS